MSSNELNYVATCLFGLERLVGEEIDALGYTRTGTIDGRVYFKGPVDAVPRTNINLRTAERVYIELYRFEARTFTELFDGTRKVPWEKIISEKDAFPVKGHSIKSTLYSVPDCQSIVKKAVVERLKDKYRTEWFEETGVKYQIEFFILNDIVSLMIDTSGLPLHKRGYRLSSTEAPIRETLAAALVKLAHLKEGVRLWDPFCGSGTIAIEAALLMTNTAPGINRSFAAESFALIPKKAWENARQEARQSVKQDGELTVFASDIDANALKKARENIRRAGMDKYIKTFVKDATQITSDGVRTTIVCNPPYGERLDSISQSRQLYRSLGKNFPKLSPWQIYVITSEEEFEKLYGQKADKVRKLYNGMIKCNYYQFFKRKD